MAHPAVAIVAVTGEKRERLPEELAGWLATRIEAPSDIQRFVRRDEK